MLKLTYTDVGLHMERVATSVEGAIAQRVILAIRLGHSLHLEPGRAAFLLPANIPELGHLKRLLQGERSGTVTVLPVDDEFVEVNLQGIWVAAGKEANEGMFLSGMDGAFSKTWGDRTEFFIYTLWQMSQARISSPA